LRHLEAQAEQHDIPWSNRSSKFRKQLCHKSGYSSKTQSNRFSQYAKLQFFSNFSIKKR